MPLEVKAKTAQANSAQAVLKQADKYHVKHIIKFGDYNVGRQGQLITLQNYMQFLLDLEPEEIVLEPIDVDAVNALAKKILGYCFFLLISQTISAPVPLAILKI